MSINLPAPTSFEFEGLELRATLAPGRGDDPWFSVNDVCAMLGYADVLQAQSRHVPEEHRLKLRVATKGGPQSLNFISEGGLYALVMRSRLPTAVKFQRWVTDVVLPSIRKDGGYIDPNASDEQIKALAKRVTSIAAARKLTLVECDALLEANPGESVLRDLVEQQSMFLYSSGREKAQAQVRRDAHKPVVFIGLSNYDIKLGRAVYEDPDEDDAYVISLGGTPEPRQPAGGVEHHTTSATNLTPAGKVKKTNRKLAGRVASSTSSGPRPVLR